MKFRVVLFTVALVSACGAPSPQADKPSDEQGTHPNKEDTVTSASSKPSMKEGARVFFVSPADGATVPSPVKLEFGLEGAEVKPAGENVPNSGHHHLIINGSGIEQGVVVPKDETHIHYGGGQTSAEVELSPGEYTLTMQFANFLHLSYGEVGAAQIKITVTE